MVHVVARPYHCVRHPAVDTVPVVLTEEEEVKLEALHALAAEWCTTLGIPRLSVHGHAHLGTTPDRLTAMAAGVGAPAS